MRYEGKVRSFTGPATDLNSEANSLYRFCILSAGKVALSTAAGVESIGVLINKPLTGETAAIQYTGIASVRASAAIAAMAKVSSTNDGRAKTAATTEVSHGIALTAAAAAGDIIEVELNLNGYKI